MILSKTGNKRIMALFLFIALLLNTLVKTNAAENKNSIPVLMIDDDQVMGHIQIDPRPLEKLSNASFSDILHDCVEHSDTIIIFVEKSLSVEDICSKDKYGSPFVHLRANLLENRAKYFPSVLDPYTLLSRVFPPQENNTFSMSTTSKLQLTDSFKYIYINFEDGVNETKSDRLRHHDAIIREVIFVVRKLKPGPVIGFYTGKVNPVTVENWEAIRNKLNGRNMPKDVVISVISPRALYKFTQIYTATATRRTNVNNVPRVAKELYNPQKLVQNLRYPNFDLMFSFNLGEESWLLEYVAMYEDEEEVGRTAMNVGAPWNFSYYCPEPITIINTRDGSIITMSTYKIEPRLLGPNDNPEKMDEGRHGIFSRSVHCGPYFTADFIACCFVTVICLSIAFYGIMSLYDCVSNNRFEDPDSKPLVHEVMH